jgi:hypothetical protein
MTFYTSAVLMLQEVEELIETEIEVLLNNPGMD